MIDINDLPQVFLEYVKSLQELALALREAIRQLSERVERLEKELEEREWQEMGDDL